MVLLLRIFVLRYGGEVENLAGRAEVLCGEAFKADRRAAKNEGGEKRWNYDNIQ